MVAKTPIRATLNGSEVTGLAEYQSGEFIDLSHGGLGASLSIGTTGQVLKVNSGGTALEFGNVEAVINIDTANDLTGSTLVSSDQILLSDGGTEGRVTLSQLDTLFSGTTQTLTNKTFDANGTGNSISNIEVADFASGVVDTDLATVSASDDTLASAKAIKTYVDSQVTAQDLDLTTDSGTIAIDLDTETLTVSGGTGIDTSATGNAVTVAIDSSVVTDSSTHTLTNKTFDANGTGNSLSNVEVADFAGSAIVIESEGIGSNDNDTTIPTSAAVKDYVDNAVTAQDLDFQGDSGGALSIDLDSETLTIAGGTGINTSGATNTLTVGIDNTVVATLSDTQTLTNKTINLTSNTLTGTTTEFNTALSDANFVTQDGSGNVTVSGNLTVNGTTTTINTETINLADNTIVLNSNATGSASENGGIEIERGDDTNKTLIWNETTDKWTVGSETFVAGTFEGALTGNVTGDVTGNADTATALETARTIAGQSFDGTADITIASTDLSDTSNVTLNNATQTLTNKTLTSPTISDPTITGDATFDTNTLHVDSTNNRIGIGTTSPAVGLDFQMINSEEGFRVRRHNASGQYIDISETDGSKHEIKGVGTKEFRMVNDTTDSGQGWHFYRNGSERFRILGDGLITLPSGAATLVGDTTTQTLTNKTIDASSNTISNIGNSQLISGIDAAKISSGSVSNTEFDYLDGVTSSIQTQLDDKASKGFAIAMAIAL